MSSGLDGLVDVHTHIVPESFPDYIGRHFGAPWPSMAPAEACHRHVMVSGSVYRTVSHQCWDCAQRRADMHGMGISRQVLSPMPELLSYWLEPEDGAAMCRFLNETIAAMVADSPQHFFGLAAVPRCLFTHCGPPRWTGSSARRRLNRYSLFPAKPGSPRHP